MKKITAAILAAALLLSFTACGAKPDPDETAPEAGTSASDPDAAPSSGGTTAPEGKTEPTGIVMLPTGSIQNWEGKKAPYFNPLGDAALYSDAECYDGNTDLALSETDQNGTVISKYYFGRLTELRIEDEKLTKDWIVYQAEKIGAAVSDGYTDDENEKVLNFTATEPDGTLLAARVSSDDNWKSAFFAMVECPVIQEGRSITLTSSDPCFGEDRAALFCLVPEAGKAWSLKLDFDKAWEDTEIGLGVSMTYEITAGKGNEYTWGSSYRNLVAGSSTASGGKSLNYVFDNIPPVDAPVSIRIDIPEDFPKDVSFTLSAEKNSVGSTISCGTSVGEIRLRGGARTDVSIEETQDIPYLEDFYYYDEDVIRTDGEDAVIKVPSGYYQLRIGSEALNGPSIRVQNVPVSAGKVTVVDLPDEMWTTYSAMVSIFGESSAEAGNMEVIKFTDNGETGVLNVMIHDPEERNILPGNDDFKIRENGVEAKVIGVERVTAPVDVVLCLDTSGSMGKNMEAAKDAAIKFVEGLPDDSTVRLISFQDYITEHSGSSKEEIIAAIRTLKSIGATTLYDAVARALELLGDCDNGYVVVFSDGDDSRESGIADVGSSISSDEMLSLIEASGKTVLTIGFGAAINPYMLDEMAGLSVGGGYFTAADASELEAAFSGVASKFGNQFIITYERPLVTVNLNSDVPVVSMMMDMSGSMNLDPKEYPDEDVDYRIDRIKSVFHSFVSRLPEKTLVQYATFTSQMGWYDIRIGEATTVNKADVFAAMGQSEAEGGTPITLALKTSMAALSPITSSKRVLVFFTDAALGINSDEDESGSLQMELDNTLRQFKALGIRVLFVGLGGKEYISRHEDVFRHAAELAGGEYIITSDAGEIQKKLDELLSKIDVPSGDGKTLNIGVSLDCMVEGGEPMQYSVNYFDSDAVLRTKEGEVIVPGFVTIRDGGAVSAD